MARNRKILLLMLSYSISQNQAGLGLEKIKYRREAIIMRTRSITSSLWPLFLVIFVAFLTGCASFGPTKPNPVYEGPCPPKFSQLAEKNSLLFREFGKLPELQDGISDSEAEVLEQLCDLYNEAPERFDAAFEQMYVIGKPEVRKFCTPLQALFWFAKKDIEETRKQLEEGFHLESLLAASWWFQEEPTLPLSEQEAKKVINSIKSDELKKEYYPFLDRIEVLNNLILLDYRKNPDIFSREARKIISSSQTEKEELKWEDPKKVIDRLNSPELFKYWFLYNFKYDWDKAHKGHKWAQSAERSITTKEGLCHDAAYLACVCLKRAGYKATGLNVYFVTPTYSGSGGHSVCIVKMKELDKSVYYIVGDTSVFRTSSPFGSIKEAAKYIANYLDVPLKRYTTGTPGWMN